MCRWLAYQGPSIQLGSLLVDSGHSLLDQSLDAREIEWPTNGDGFGVGWYGRRPHPGVFRDVLPIWNDPNLIAISEQVESRLFFAHIRKATGGAIQRTNCHPFSHGRWLFQHNGEIPNFSVLKQRLYAEIAPELFPALQGSTDTECMFLLALTHGLEHDPPAAFATMIETVERVRSAVGVDAPFTCTIAASNGERIWAVRHSSWGDARTLYYSTHRDALCDFDACSTELPPGAVIIASEPLGHVGTAWTAVAPSSLLVSGSENVSVTPLDLPRETA